MTNTPHDNFAKGYLKTLLSPLGKVETSREIIDEPRLIDVLFSPSSPTSVPPESIGLLGRLAVETAAIEVFRNQPNDYEMLMCANRLFSYQAFGQGTGNREQQEKPARIFGLKPLN